MNPDLRVLRTKIKTVSPVTLREALKVKTRLTSPVATREDRKGKTFLPTNLRVLLNKDRTNKEARQLLRLRYLIVEFSSQIVSLNPPF
jgi:hypothetical protein